ncbi:MAG: A/G-specific adenine glycosylase [Pseudomonadota bacterium]
MNAISDRWFAEELLRWASEYGRHDLPWQQNRTAYRVWVSEIMLQQTQVQTVIGYYQRFMERFPDVCALAGADIDDVLALWSGLGYYARGRNLHKSAQRVVAEHGGNIPTDISELMALPGIGRSTAGAILALSDDQALPILDGNVKRVLARFHAVEGWPGDTKVVRSMWTLAENHTPGPDRVAAYTQAIMDLGAMVCTRNRPQCACCPVSSACAAYREARTDELPHRKPKKALPQRSTHFLIVRDPQRAVLLRRRPPTGIWGGLYGFLEFEDENSIDRWLQRHGLETAPRAVLPIIEHGFSHYRLSIHPTVVEGIPRGVTDVDSLWYKPEQDTATVGLAAPVSRLLASLG